MKVPVHHRYATVDGWRLFYREAGRPDAPAIVLLHGFPTSSFMFRDLIPRLADRYHVIAPDHLGLRVCPMHPRSTEFDYTFDALDRPHRGAARPARRPPVRDLRPGLRRADRLAARAASPGRHHRDRHPERQRLRRRVHRELLDDGVGLPARADPETEAAVRTALASRESGGST